MNWVPPQLAELVSVHHAMTVTQRKIYVGSFECINPKLAPINGEFLVFTSTYGLLLGTHVHTFRQNADQ
jgi:hypothetical protein